MREITEYIFDRNMKSLLTIVQPTGIINYLDLQGAEFVSYHQLLNPDRTVGLLSGRHAPFIDHRDEPITKQ